MKSDTLSQIQQYLNGDPMLRLRQPQSLGQLATRLYGPARLKSGKCVAYSDNSAPRWTYDDLLSGQARSTYGYDHVGGGDGQFAVDANANFGTVWSYASGKCVYYARSPADVPYSMHASLFKSGRTIASPTGDVDMPAGVFDPRKTWAEILGSTPIGPGGSSPQSTTPPQWGTPGMPGGAPGYPPGYGPQQAAATTDWGTYIGYGGLALGALLIITSLAKK